MLPAPGSSLAQRADDALRGALEDGLGHTATDSPRVPLVAASTALLITLAGGALWCAILIVCMARCFRAGGKAKGASPRRSDKQFLRFHDDASASAEPGLGAEAGKVLQRIADRLSAVSPVPLSVFALPEYPFAARALALRLSPDDSPRKRPESPQQPSSKASSMAHFSSEGGEEGSVD